MLANGKQNTLVWTYRALFFGANLSNLNSLQMKQHPYPKFVVEYSYVILRWLPSRYFRNGMLPGYVFSTVFLVLPKSILNLSSLLIIFGLGLFLTNISNIIPLLGSSFGTLFLPYSVFYFLLHLLLYLVLYCIKYIYRIKFIQYIFLYFLRHFISYIIRCFIRCFIWYISLYCTSYFIHYFIRCFIA